MTVGGTGFHSDRDPSLLARPSRSLSEVLNDRGRVRFAGPEYIYCMNRMSTIRTLCFRAIVLVLFSPGLSRAQDLAITRATVYTAPEAPARRDVTVLIRHGVIAGVGEHLPIPR